MKIKRSENGFGVAGLLTVIVAIVLVAGSGWYVFNKRQEPTQQVQAPSKKTVDTPKNVAVIPAGYKKYTSTEHGFSYAYPAEWGELKAWDDSTRYGYTMATNELKAVPITSAVLTGHNAYTVSDKADFIITAQKYGATVKAVKDGQGYSWVATEVNPADTTHKVGDTYEIPIIKTTSGAEIYDFTWSDEGATHARFVFKPKDRFVTITLPYIWSGEGMEGTTKAEADAYSALSRKIMDSLTIF